MFFGVAADPETEFGMACFEECDQFVGVAEAVGLGLENSFALGGIAAQGHDVAEAVGMNLVGEGVKFVTAVTDAREVRHHGEA